MGRERYVVRLEREERDQLERLIRGGRAQRERLPGARILLKADTGWGVMRIVEALDTSAGTVCRTKRRYLEGGLKRALEEDPRPGHPTKLDERGEAHLIALACSEAPQAMTTGPCGSWQTRWWSWGWRPPCPTREFASG